VVPWTWKRDAQGSGLPQGIGNERCDGQNTNQAKHRILLWERESEQQATLNPNQTASDRSMRDQRRPVCLDSTQPEADWSIALNLLR